jgi:Fe-S-cluster containining protein
MSEHASSQPDGLAELERQVERGSLFTHACLEAVSDRLLQAESLLAQLLDGTSTQPEPEPSGDVNGSHAGGWHDADEGNGAQLPWPGIALGAEEGEEAGAPPVAVNCAERMHVCQAVCCKLAFALRPSEVEAGSVKWDLGHPYMVRHAADGYCVHNDRRTGFCGVYADRPHVCRRYSCANDPRIWKDFDRMELNHEWIDEKLASQGRIVFNRPQPRMEDVV